jgi:hypothetical protein
MSLPSGSTTVLSGSYNWTNQARRNHEGLTVLDGDIQVAADLMVQFFKVKDPFRSLRRSSMTDTRRSESSLPGDSKPPERLSGVLKRLRDRHNGGINPSSS